MTIESTEPLARQNWVSACQFHDLSGKEVLDEISKRVREQEKPLVLLDLDSTLYEVGPRTYQILVEWARSAQDPRFANVQKKVLAMDPAEVKYSVNETLLHLNVFEKDLHAPESLRSAEKFWFDRFFTNEYLKYDHAYSGAAAFAQRIYNLGAEVVYLTGRDEPGMGDGTRANLLRDGFPWEKPRTHLLMKPTFQQADLAHKLDAADYIRRHGVLVASFENEPPNVVALSQVFPEAMHVFMDTVCSDLLATPQAGLYRIQSFI
jgi:hypothetical protein